MRNEGEGGGSVIGMLQTALKSGLELAFQLDAIDYAATNFVHADMTPQEFKDSMAERGETLLGLIWKMVFMGAGQQPSEAALAAQQFDIVQAFRSGEGRHKLRMAMAMQLEQVEHLVAGLALLGDALRRGDHGPAILTLRPGLVNTTSLRCD